MMNAIKSTRILCGAEPVSGYLCFEDGKIKIDRDNCQHCGNCVENCYTDGLKAAGEYHEKAELIKTLCRDRDF